MECAVLTSCVGKKFDFAILTQWVWALKWIVLFYEVECGNRVDDGVVTQLGEAVEGLVLL